MRGSHASGIGTSKIYNATTAVVHSSHESGAPIVKGIVVSTDSQRIVVVLTELIDSAIAHQGQTPSKSYRTSERRQIR